MPRKTLQGRLYSLCIFVKSSVSSSTEYSWNATDQSWHKRWLICDQIKLTVKSMQVISNQESWVLGAHDDPDTITSNTINKDAGSVKWHAFIE